MLVHVLVVVLELGVGDRVHVLVLRDQLLVVHQRVLEAHLVRVEAGVRVLPIVRIAGIVELVNFVLLHGLLVLVLDGVPVLISGTRVLGHLLPVERCRVQHRVHRVAPQILSRPLPSLHGLLLNELDLSELIVDVGLMGGILLRLRHHNFALHEHEVAVHLGRHPREGRLLVQHGQVPQNRDIKVCWE